MLHIIKKNIRVLSMGFLTDLRQQVGTSVSRLGHDLHLPELGLSEKIAPRSNMSSWTPAPLQTPVKTIADPGSTAGGGGGGTYYGGGSAGGGGGGGATSVEDISFLNDQANQLRALLGRTDTALNQGLTRNNDEYNRNVGDAQGSHDSQVQDQNTQKLKAYDTINRNAGNSYHSLASIIGRAAGTGSSAFQELLPDVVGKDTSSKRQDVTNTNGQNISKIDTSFADVLADLLRQKKDNENTLRSGVETQRQDINGKLATNAGQVAQAKGGGFAAVKAAQTPFQAAIDNSRNAVESFFDTFRTPYTPKAVQANLADYTTDRSSVNAKTDPAVDPTNPYSAILRKRLQGSI
jgi:hypothetical protein